MKPALTSSRLSDEAYMRRALQLAAYAAGYARPNPMVGAVIVGPSGRIIGEGWTQPYGGPHAEVMAVRSVSAEDRPLLGESTIYVTLEPCSHWGKTPPCAGMLIGEGIPRVVVGALDPFEKVSGRGVRMLREAGREVVTGLLREECEHLNRRFMTAHRLRRPFVELKWAQTADGVMGRNGGKRLHISNSLSLIAMHRDRAMADAVMVGTDTAIADRPQLTVRHADCRANPVRITFDRHDRLPEGLFDRDDDIIIRDNRPLPEILTWLYEEKGVTSLIVEGGLRLLDSFLASGLWDELRVETSSLSATTSLSDNSDSSDKSDISDNSDISDKSWIKAPEVPAEAILEKTARFGTSTVRTYRKK